ncbi:MAG: crossover junction endodeoxyribonuclease RuvC, partial [Fusobacteriaceae bacterium]
MRVLGIDPGTAIVGYGIIDYIKNSYIAVDYGCIFTDKNLDMENRLVIIFDELSEIIEKFKPDAIAIEELFFFKNNKTVISVGQARGIMILAGMKKGIKPVGYTPLQVKMGITGYGKAD